MVQSYSSSGANVPSHGGTLAPSGEYDWTCASFGPPEYTTQMANRSVQLFLPSSRQKVPIFYNGRPFSPRLPFSWGIWTPILFMIPWASPSPQSKQNHDRFSSFHTGDRRVTVYFTTGRPFPSKLPISMGESGPQSNTWFPGPTQVLNPNSILIGSAVFAGLTSVTDWLTDQPTDHTTRSVTIDSIDVRSMADAV